MHLWFTPKGCFQGQLAVLLAPNHLHIMLIPKVYHMKYFGMLAIFLQDKSAADTWNYNSLLHCPIIANSAGLHLLQEMPHLVKNFECSLVRPAVGGCFRGKYSSGKDETSDVVTNHVLIKSSMHT